MGVDEKIERVGNGGVIDRCQYFLCVIGIETMDGTQYKNMKRGILFKNG